MNKIKSGLCLLCTTVLLTGCYMAGYDDLNHKSTITDVLLLETNETKEDLCLVTTENNYVYAYDIIPNRYLVLTELKGKYKYIHEGGNIIFNVKYQKHDLNVYSVETKELVKTYTLKDLYSSLPKGYQIYLDYGMTGFRREGQDYLLFSAVQFKRNPKEDYIEKCVTINLETDEIVLYEDVSSHFELLEERSERAEKFKVDLDIFHEWTLEPDRHQFLTANGFIPLLKQNDSELSEKRFYCVTGFKTKGFLNEGIAEIEITANALPKENKELYTKFPGLKEYQGQEGLVAIIFLDNFPTTEEIFRLFIEEGAEISFEGCIMDGKYSKDGQPHEISSFEEFYEWYRPIKT